MKKLSYLLGLLLIGGLIFSACSKDDEEEDPPPQDLTPYIEFIGMSADTTIAVGDSLYITLTCESNAVSGTNLDKFEIYIDAPGVDPDPIFIVTDIDNMTFAFAEHTQPFPFPLDGMLYAKITDVDGEFSEVSFNLTVENSPLEGEMDLTWERTGGAGIGMEMFGLKWTSNVKEVMAVIQKDGADKFVQLDAGEWNTIITKQGLMAAVDAGEDLGDIGYRGVSAEAGGDYDDVLGVQFGEEYFIIHITDAIVEAPTPQGTPITINGMYNK